VKKHLETWLKSFSSPRDQLSAVPPDQYASRFVKFIKDTVRSKETSPRAKEDLSHVPIPEESPVITPSVSIEKKIQEPVKEAIIRTLISAPNGLDQKMSVVKVQRPNPEIEKEEFKEGLENGIHKTRIEVS
jgi:Phosphatidylinositol-4-phosphate 5-Kinase